MKRGHTQPLMLLNRQLECGFSKRSPSLINTFVLSPRWAASWNACNCHWLEKMFFFKRQNLKIAFYQHFRTLNASPPPMKLFGNQQLECLQGYIFSRQKHIYILDPPSHHKKKLVHHIIFIVLAFFQGIWRLWVYECTCLRISPYFLCTLQVWVLLLAFPIR